MTLVTKIMEYLKPRLVAIILSLIAVLWLQASNLVDPFSVDEDFRSFYWMNKYQDPDLFPNDPYRGNGSIDIATPWGDWPYYPASTGYGLLFYAVNFVVPLLTISKLLPLILMPLTVAYLYEFGRTVRSAKTGLILAVGFMLINLVSPTSVSLLTGLQRSFAFTLIVALIYYLERQRYIAAMITIVLAALIYPPMFMLGSVTWGFAALRINREAWFPLVFDKHAFITLLIAGFLSMLITIPTLLTIFPHLFTPSEAAEVTVQTAPTHQSLWTNPHYQTDGRKALFSFFPFIGRVGLFDELLDGMNALILLTIGLLIVSVRGRRAFDLPRIIYYLLLASIITFVISWLAILLTNSFLLYLPSRYTRIGLSLFLMVFVFFNSEDFLKEAAFAIQRHQHKLIWLYVGVETFILSLIILYPSNDTGFLGFNMKWLLASAALVFGILGTIKLKNGFTITSTPTQLGQT
ncbi:MAG TPA: hypothetical protein P5526_17665, partial [Anaerolineae bacterium]|nr:hypothetical protein [Anaerolineae bacterium]